MSSHIAENPFLSIFFPHPEKKPVTNDKAGKKMYEVAVVSANLRKDMSTAAYKHAIRVVFSKHGRAAIVGLQEVSEARDKAIVHDFIVKEKGWAIFGMEYECPIYWDPTYWKIGSSARVIVVTHSQPHQWPSRVTTFAPFGLVENPDLRVKRANCHMMNGVYTSNYIGAFHAERAASWHHHYDINNQLAKDNTDAPFFINGDCNAHPPKFNRNPFGPNTTVAGTHHISDYIGVGTHHPGHAVERTTAHPFHDPSDHLGLYAHYRIGT